MTRKYEDGMRFEDVVALYRYDDDVAVAIGFAGDVEIEMVGLLTADGKTLVIHAMSPATEKVTRELGIGRR